MLAFLGSASLHLYPRSAQIIAYAIPVFPLVASTRILFRVNSPRRSPSRIMFSAARSFTLPPGLYHSALASTSTGAASAVTRLNDNIGVLPISCNSDLPWVEDG